MTTPIGWQALKLGDLGRYLNGRAFKREEWSVEGRPIIRIQNLTGTSTAYNHFSGDVEDRYLVRRGDLLVSWAATLGAFLWDGPEAVLNQHIFRVESNVDKRFHKYLLDHKLDELMRHTHGSGMVHITRGAFDRLPVAVPNLTIQRRIVEILEDHLSRLDSADRGITMARARLRALREQVIVDTITGADAGHRKSAALAGAGTSDGSLSPLPDGWHWARLVDIADVVGGVTKDAKKQSDPALSAVPYLRVANVQRGHLNLDQVTTIRVPESKAQALALQPGDVLLNEGGDRDKLARGWVWEGQIPGCIHQNHVFRARIREPRLDPYFLSWTANTLGGSWAERNGKQSVNLASISLSMIKKMPVIVPADGEATRRRDALTDRLAAIARLEANLSAAIGRSAALRRSLLAAAFSGRLTMRAG